MSLLQITQQLRSLTYREMNELAAEIHEQLNPNIPTADIAEVLANLELRPGEAEEFSRREEEFLREAFRRKRTMSIARDGNGWKINCSTLPGSQVVGTELRPMFARMLDQIITMEALKDGN